MRFTSPVKQTTTCVAWSSLFSLLLVCFSSVALAQENLPALGGANSTDRVNDAAPAGGDTDTSLEDARCPEIVDAPLSSLTIDVSPRDPKGNYVPLDDRPRGCWVQNGKSLTPIFLEAGLGSCDLGCCEILQLARFCHPPVYLEDERFERCGQFPCCPCVYSTTRFLFDVALLPAQLIVQTPCSCVRTPTPHCCSPCDCGR